jgi:hypothetical protein
MALQVSSVPPPHSGRIPRPMESQGLCGTVSKSSPPQLLNHQDGHNINAASCMLIVVGTTAFPHAQYWAQRS